MLLAILFWYLYLRNLQSRMLYHGPNWSFLGWVATYFTVTGIGLLMLRKWALLLSFLPAVAILFPLAGALHRGESLTMSYMLLVIAKLRDSDYCACNSSKKLAVVKVVKAYSRNGLLRCL